jgi:uncharacterized protein
VRGTLTYNQTESPAVVFAHGFGSNRGGEKSVALEDECARRGWAYAACDFRGHGDSGGTMLELTGSSLIEDLDAVTLAVMQRITGPLFLVGSSMGAWTSAWLAARAPERVLACALIAPALHFLEWNGLTERDRADWRRTGRLTIRNDFVDTEISYALYAEAEKFTIGMLADRLRQPLIVFHGMRDELIAYTASLEFVARSAAAELELIIIKTGDHRLSLYKTRIARTACDFFADTA